MDEFGEDAMMHFLKMHKEIVFTYFQLILPQKLVWEKRFSVLETPKNEKVEASVVVLS